MRKIAVSVLVLLFSIPTLWALNEMQESPYPPTYSYTTLSTGFSISAAEGEDMRNAIPVSFQAGVLSNNESGSMALGFGTRIDIGFGIGSNSRNISIDTMAGLDMLFRFNRSFALDVLAGCAFGFIDTEENPDLLTMGPALSAALRITPAGFSAVALDAGVAVYGQFGIGDEYTGVNFVPYVSITFDLSSWPVLFHPYHSSHVIIF